jgi:hypothetical protein
MNLLPSFGYSTGFYMQPTNFRPPTTAGNTGGNRAIVAPPVFGVTTPGFNQRPATVNQRQTSRSPQQFNFTTNPAPQPRLSRGLLNN